MSERLIPPQRWRFYLLASFVMTCLTAVVSAQDKAQQDKLDLTELSLEELAQVEVVSVSRRKGEALFDAPAAVTVISQEDIRRTGHQHLPEILRLVPGMHVGRIDANKWAVAARGFNDRFNNFQLVQMDGRSIYSPFFGGTFWIAQDYLLEDLERVEAIRGPGGTQWGANAVNGIVSFTSKDSRDTQGLLVSGAGGSAEGAIAGVRYGGQITEDFSYRVYGKFQEHPDFQTGTIDYSDDWMRWQGGARFDWAPKGGKDKVTFQGDVYGVERAGSNTVAPNIATGFNGNDNGDERYHGYNGLARWTHELNKDNEIQIQTYYDYFKLTSDLNRKNKGQDLVGTHGTYDLDYQHSLKAGSRQKIVYGLNFRTVDLDQRSGWILDFTPSGRRTNTYSAFFQDTITAIDEVLDFTVGSKLEHNDYTGFEVQPSFRTVYKPKKDHVLWWAVSRAVRVPSLIDNDIILTPIVVLPNLPVVITGNPGLEPEKVTALEFGYRTRPLKWFSLDLATFYNFFDDMTQVTPRAGSVLQNRQRNMQDAEAFGAEFSTTFNPVQNWRFTLNYSFLKVIGGPVERSSENENAPNHLFHFRSYYDIAKNWELNNAVYYASDIAGQKIPDVWRVDLGVTWRPVKDLEVSLWGVNLQEKDHLEYRGNAFTTRATTEIPRSVFLKIDWKF